jgi:PRTRC genetic system protein C
MTMTTNKPPASESAGPTISVPPRIFRMGAIDLPDPDPSLTPVQALRLYQGNYPHLAHARLAEPILEGEKLIYVIEKPPVQTKGARHALPAPASMTSDQALRILDAWRCARPAPLPAERPASDGAAAHTRWTSHQIAGVHHVLSAVAACSQLTAAVSPWLLPPP